MAATTPVLALPYPVPADTVDVPRDIQALATKLDGIKSIDPPIVPSLPSSPVAHQLIYIVPESTLLWTFYYDTTAGWVTQASVPVLRRQTLVDPVPSTATVMPGIGGGNAITVPYAGTYRVRATATGQSSIANIQQLTCQVLRNGTAIGDTIVVACGTAFERASTQVLFEQVLAKNDLLTMNMRSTNASAMSLINAQLELDPLKIN